MSLPTYEEAISGSNVWTLVGEYVDSSTLVALCSVNRYFTTLLSPLLWRHPMKLIASKPYPFSRAVAFVNCARIARRPVRGLVHFLDFRPLMALRSTAHADFTRHEHTISTAWVLRHAELFENLRFMIVDEMDVISEKDAYPKALIPQNESAISRVLVFSVTRMCRDTSSILKAEYFENIIFLDISYTARSESWTRAISGLPLNNLRVLKLRGLRLTDRNLPRCVLKSECRLWSLDLSDNFLTDQTIDALLQSSFLPSTPKPVTFGASDDETLYEDTPSYVRLPSHQALDNICDLRLDDLDSFAKYLNSYPDLAGSAPFTTEDAYHNLLTRPTGLTHLYLSSNKFTSSGIHSLLDATNRLQVLDAGSVRHVPSQTFYIPFTTAYAQPDTAKLLSRSSGTRLEFIRIHHSVITHVPTILSSSHDIKNDDVFQLPWLKVAETIFGPKQRSSWESFSPLENYRISTVTLTGIPTKSLGMVIDSLLSFLKRCVEQQRVLDSTKDGCVVNRRSPRLLTGLRKLRLEFVSVSKRAHSLSPFESVSEDTDADEFTRQGRGDFSFFGDGDTEDGKGESWSSIRRGSGSQGVRDETEVAEDAGMRDVIEEIKAWRLTDEGQGWRGKLELIRPVG